MTDPSHDCEHGYRAAGGTFDCPACAFGEDNSGHDTDRDCKACLIDTWHKDRPVTIPELTQALRQCYELFHERGEGSTMFTLPLLGLIERAEAQVPPCETCGGSGNDPQSRWMHETPCSDCGGSGASREDKP